MCAILTIICDMPERAKGGTLVGSAAYHDLNKWQKGMTKG